MNRARTILIFFCLTFQLIKAQVYSDENTIKFIKKYGTWRNDILSCVRVDANDNIYLVGYSEGVNACLSPDFYLIKTDPFGNVLTTHNYGRCSEGDDVLDMLITSDNKILMYGRANFSSLGGSDIYLVKTDLDGNLIWDTIYGGSLHDGGWQILETRDHNYLQIATVNANYPSTPAQLALIKTDTSGTILWQKNYNCPTLVKDALELPNGDVLVCGTHDTLTGIISIVLMFDKNGNMKWQKCPVEYTLPYYTSQALTLIQKGDNEFMVSGIKDTVMPCNGFMGICNFSGYIMGFDSLGNFGPKKTIPYAYGDIQKTKTGGFVAVGGEDWYHTLGVYDSGFIGTTFSIDEPYYGFYRCAETSDGYVFAGLWNDNMSSYDFALGKVNKTGNYILSENENYFKVYPNPFAGDITVSFDLFEPKHISFILKGIDGKFIMNLFDENLKQSTSYNYTFHLSEVVSQGMYILEMYYDDKKVIKKIVRY